MLSSEVVNSLEAKCIIDIKRALQKEGKVVSDHLISTIVSDFSTTLSGSPDINDTYVQNNSAKLSKFLTNYLQKPRVIEWLSKPTADKSDGEYKTYITRTFEAQLIQENKNAKEELKTYNKVATRIQAAFRGYTARKDGDPVSLVDSTSERDISPIPSPSSSPIPISIAQAKAALPKVDKKATMAMLAEFRPTAEVVRNHKIAQALVDGASKHLGTIKEISEEGASMPDVFKSTTGIMGDHKVTKSKRNALGTIKEPSEEDAARKIQSGFRKRNKLAISAIKMAGRIASRKGSGAAELKTIVSRTIKEHTVGKAAAPTAGPTSVGLRKTGIDLTK